MEMEATHARCLDKRKTMNKFVHRMLCKNYERSALAMVEEIRERNNEISVTKTPVVLEYEENLKLLRLFLDNYGMSMPNPKWRYNHRDQATWLFSNQSELNRNFMLLRGGRR